jgi:hypothetical protein
VKREAQRVFLVICLAVAVCAQAFGLHQVVPSQHAHRASKRRTRFRRLLWNPVFRPSRDSLLRQNEEIDRLELPRIQNQAELDQLIARQELVPIVAGQTLRFDPRLDPDRRYCRPWTRDFLDDLSDAYYKQFHDQIQVNSAVRTVQVQKKLRRHNRNAAPEKGETASSHLAGITVDIQRRGMTRQQVQWMEAYMMPLRDQGLVEPEEERHQWVFHVAVSGRYADWREPKTPAPDRQEDAQYDESLATPNQSVDHDQQPEFCSGPSTFSLATDPNAAVGFGCGINPLR